MTLVEEAAGVGRSWSPRSACERAHLPRTHICRSADTWDSRGQRKSFHLLQIILLAETNNATHAAAAAASVQENRLRVVGRLSEFLLQVVRFESSVSALVFIIMCCLWRTLLYVVLYSRLYLRFSDE